MNEVRLRLATQRDMLAIRAFHQGQNERDGTNYPLPELFAPNGDFAANIAIALVGEREGQVVQCLYVEKVAELCFAGCDPAATAYAQRDIERLAYLLRAQGLTGLQCIVPREVAPAISKPLVRAGFERTDKRLVHFFKDLRERPEADDEGRDA